MCTFGLSGCRVKPRRLEVKHRRSVAPKGVGGGGRGEGGRRVGSRGVGPKGSGPLSPGFRVWVWEGLGSRSECLWVWSLGFLVFRKFDQNTRTLKLAKVGLAKVNTLKH